MGASGRLAGPAWYSLVVSVFVLVLLQTARVSAATPQPCTSGILQITPLPPGPLRDQCMSTFDIGIYSLKAVCGAGFRVTVDQDSIIRMVPLEMDRITYNFGTRMSFDCKNLNASGLFDAGSTTSATVTLFDDKSGPLSSLTKVGPNQVALLAAHTYDIQTRAAKDPQCTYIYNVTSGCVLGAQAPTPAPSPTTCPPGHAPKVGRFNTTFCQSCPPQTYSPGGANVTACIPCPIGTENRFRAASECTPCGEGWYAPTPGLGCRRCGSSSTDWTDGRTKCGKCPEGSTVFVNLDRSKCGRCYAGKKCCTVNWDSSCPKCTDSSKPAKYISSFVLESATPASCLASNNAICAPKIWITIDGTCQISTRISNPKILTCPGDYSSFPIRGPSAEAVRDLSVLRAAYKFSPSFAITPSMADGNVTAVSAPYLSITVQSENCTYRYRALTKPAATILGAAPKPAPPTPCPRGSYVDTTTDTPPGPCLPCPPGTFSTKPGKGPGTCTPCPAGTYAALYGSTGCAKCPLGKISQMGASKCKFCEYRKYANPDRRTCSSCPNNTLTTDGGFSEGSGACLGIADGAVCCAAGLCDKQVRCGSAKIAPLVGGPGFLGTAFFRLKSSSFSSPACKSATYLSCLRAGSRYVTSIMDPTSFTLKSADAGTKCASNPSVPFPDSGGVIPATTHALFVASGATRRSSEIYEILTNPATRTFTVYLSAKSSTSDNPTIPAPIKECSATFDLLHGYFLDLKPATAACPAAAITVKTGSRTVCRFCGPGGVKASKGTACKTCPRGTFQLQFDGANCRPCPRGHSCSQPGALPKPCSNGSYSPNQGLAGKCLTCPAGTFSGGGANLACTKCRTGSSAPRPGSTSCGVPWQTRF